MTDCVFCMVAAGEIPAQIVYSDDTVIAFHDISPQSPVHVLIIPREHYASLQDDVPDATLAALFRAVRDVARATGVDDSGYRVIANSGADANQTVGHLHIHVMGGRPMSHGMVDFLA